MNIELEPCPFCKSEVYMQDISKFVWHEISSFTQDCPLQNVGIPFAVWQKRPNRLATSQMNDEPVACEFCPECGHDELIDMAEPTEKGHCYCARCKQEIFKSTRYSVAIKMNLQDRYHLQQLQPKPADAVVPECWSAFDVMPTEPNFYLTWPDYKELYFMAHYSGGKNGRKPYRWYDDNDIEWKPTHWMPLPAAPQQPQGVKS